MKFKILSLFLVKYDEFITRVKENDQFKELKNKLGLKTSLSLFLSYLLHITLVR